MNPNAELTIDEHFIAFRGNCPFRVFICQQSHVSMASKNAVDTLDKLGVSTDVCGRVDGGH